VLHKGIILLADAFDRSLLVFACTPFKLPYLVLRLHPVAFRPTAFALSIFIFFPLASFLSSSQACHSSIPLPCPESNPREHCFFFLFEPRLLSLFAFDPL